MEREIVKIDLDKCNGCSLCIPGCPEGALQIIDGKARLVSDLMCDGLGACIGDCPEGAIVIEKREAAPYEEVTVIKEILKHGENTLIAHLEHLQDHGESTFLKQALDYLESVKDELEFDLSDLVDKINKKENIMEENTQACGCPGSGMQDFRDESKKSTNPAAAVDQESALRQWPVQMHLINPMAPYFQNADVVLAADCVAFSLGDFHQKHLAGKGLAIACPKLDQGQEIYVSKLVQMIDEAKINTLQVMIMEVPCCGGLSQVAKMASEQATRKIPVKKTVVGIKGDILSEEWI